GNGNSGRSDIAYCSKKCRVSRINKMSNSKNPHRVGFSYMRLRFLVLSRDNYTCQYCGRRPPEATIQVDHIIPKDKLTKEQLKDYNYLITACKECNIGKSDAMLDAHKIKLLRKE